MSAKQRTFFDDEFDQDLQAKRLARRTDPRTSHQAARSIKVNQLQQKALELIRVHPMMTGRELSGIAGWDAWKRLSELADAGLIQCAGERRCSVSGRNARIWRAK